MTSGFTFAASGDGIKRYRWLYIEQSLYALEQERNPFRQRVYKLYKNDDKDVRIFCDLYEVIGLPEEHHVQKA
ncbi:MAG: hypothetical protein H6559_34330 [Lewinellaceae bacterium]|nr:hypothetical protein [Lewinellaceae bacterium]